MQSGACVRKHLRNAIWCTCLAASQECALHCSFDHLVTRMCEDAAASFNGLTLAPGGNGSTASYFIQPLLNKVLFPLRK